MTKAFNNNIILICVFTLLLTTSNVANTPPTGSGQVSVKKWADDRKSAFTFTFDDGFNSHYLYVRPILNSFGFKGSFFVITGALTDDLPGIWRYGTWNQFQTLSLEGHEIGSHTVTHADLSTLPVGKITTTGTLLYELYNSKAVIEQKIPNQKCITLCNPLTNYNNNVLKQSPNYFQSARSGGSTPNDTSLEGTEFFTTGAKEEQFNQPRNSTQDDLNELIDFKNYTENAIADGKWGILMAHEVYPFSQIDSIQQLGAWYPMSTEWLTSLCQWIKSKSDNNEVWVETMGNITRYMKEREQFVPIIISQTDAQIKLSGSTGYDTQIYNYPLTVDITVPSFWIRAVVMQGSRIDTVTTFVNGSTTYIRTKLIPDGTTLTINKLEGGPLPVELISFTAQTGKENKVLLKWQTKTEVNNHGFDIEKKKSDKVNWEKIGFAFGKGNSNIVNNYSFIDTKAINGTFSYRLKQIDVNGNFQYGNEIKVNIDLNPTSFELANYPNPFNPATLIRYKLAAPSKITLKVFNILGEMVTLLVDQFQEAGIYRETFNGKNLSSGTYIYVLEAGNIKIVKKMLLMK